MATIKTKKKKKLTHITSLMPVYNWKVGTQYMFKLPYTYGDRDTLKTNANSKVQIRTHLYKQPHKKVWAKIQGHEFSYLPASLLLNNVVFGYTLNENPELVVWVKGNKYHEIGCHMLGSLMIKGTACEPYALSKNYNPYKDYSKFVIDTLRFNKPAQISLHRMVDGYKQSNSDYPNLFPNKWEEIREVKKYVWDKFISSFTREWLSSFIDYETDYPSFRISTPVDALKMRTNLVKKDNGSQMSIMINSSNPFRASKQGLFHNGKKYMGYWTSTILKDYAENINDSYQDSEWDSSEAEKMRRTVYETIMQEIAFCDDSF